jgi:hypothetical protein
MHVTAVWELDQRLNLLLYRKPCAVHDYRDCPIVVGSSLWHRNKLIAVVDMEELMQQTAFRSGSCLKQLADARDAEL